MGQMTDTTARVLAVIGLVLICLLVPIAAWAFMNIFSGALRSFSGSMTTLDVMTVQNTGRVGIGVTEPGNVLEVRAWRDATG